jgi:hypothetical protein
MDHIGFTVESVDNLKEDVDELVGVNPVMNPIPLGKGKEGGARLDLPLSGAGKVCNFSGSCAAMPDRRAPHERPGFHLLAVRGAH